MPDFGDNRTALRSLKMFRTFRLQLSVSLCALLLNPWAQGIYAQDAPKLSIVILEGEGAINNIKQRTAREPIVRVEDENHKPVAGAAVVFTLPSQGAGGTFAGG